MNSCPDCLLVVSTLHKTKLLIGGSGQIESFELRLCVAHRRSTARLVICRQASTKRLPRRLYLSHQSVPRRHISKDVLPLTYTLNPSNDELQVASISSELPEPEVFRLASGGQLRAGDVQQVEKPVVQAICFPYAFEKLTREARR